jgi:hypothetical protein
MRLIDTAPSQCVVQAINGNSSLALLAKRLRI